VIVFHIAIQKLITSLPTTVKGGFADGRLGTCPSTKQNERPSILLRAAPPLERKNGAGKAKMKERLRCPAALEAGQNKGIEYVSKLPAGIAAPTRLESRRGLALPLLHPA
jgi:hypothetical protein